MNCKLGIIILGISLLALNDPPARAQESAELARQPIVAELNDLYDSLAVEYRAERLDRATATAFYDALQALDRLNAELHPTVTETAARLASLPCSDDRRLCSGVCLIRFNASSYIRELREKWLAKVKDEQARQQVSLRLTRLATLFNISDEVN